VKAIVNGQICIGEEDRSLRSQIEDGMKEDVAHLR